MLDRIRYKLIRWLARDEMILVNVDIHVAPGQGKPTLYVGPTDRCMVLGNIDATPEAYERSEGLVVRHSKHAPWPQVSRPWPKPTS